MTPIVTIPERLRLMEMHKAKMSFIKAYPFSIDLGYLYYIRYFEDVFIIIIAAKMFLNIKN